MEGILDSSLGTEEASLSGVCISLAFSQPYRLAGSVTVAWPEYSPGSRSRGHRSIGEKAWWLECEKAGHTTSSGSREG